ncbi:MAG: excinuclease ABC subunit UvrA, partial [Planctomycetota bacterium]
MGLRRRSILKVRFDLFRHGVSFRPMESGFIRVLGARQHNLNVRDLKIPKRKLVVFTGVSGSGKSSLAFDTLYAEGRRRYVESLSSYARQFLGQMDKPAYDRISGLSPTIAIEQKKASSNPRSTVGTITEIYDHLRVLWARIGVQHCPRCDKVVVPLSSQQVVEELRKIEGPVLLLAPLVENRKGEFKELLHDLKARGFVRVRHNGEISRVEDLALSKRKKHTLELIVDRLDPSRAAASRMSDSVETALREGRGTVVAEPVDDAGAGRRLSQNRACNRCGIGLPELSPQSFSFNSPLGMCSACNGLGRRTEMDPGLVVPDKGLSIHEGAIEPWAKVLQREDSWNYKIFRALSDEYSIDMDKPWKSLPKKHKKILLYGLGDDTLKVS